MEDVLHGGSEGGVMGIEQCWILGLAAWPKWLYGGKYWLDGFVAENDKGGDGSEPVGKRLVSDSLADALDDLFIP
jgi:hypothetical protein